MLNRLMGVLANASIFSSVKSSGLASKVISGESITLKFLEMVSKPDVYPLQYFGHADGCRRWGAFPKSPFRF